MSDSAGIRIVDWTQVDLSSLPQLRTKSAASTLESDTELYRVRDGLFVSDSVVVVANDGTGEILWLDGSARVIRRVGAKGDGPGEYRNIAWLGTGEAGTLWVFDRNHGRLTQLDSLGVVLSTRVLAPDRALVTLRPLVHMPDGVTLAVYAESREHFRLGLAETRDTVPLLRFAAAGTMDTLGVWLGQERSFAQVSQGIAAVPIGFARHLEASGRGVRAAVGATDGLAISLYEGGPRPVLIIRADWRGDPVSAGEIAAWREAVLAQLPTDNAEYRRTWEQGPVRSTHPAFERLLVDSDGRIWIGRNATPGAARRDWVVATPDGRPTARIQLPATFRALSAAPELLDAHGDLILLVRRTELDEEVVELVRMER
ncbi:MAG: hypothetical protein ACYC6F_18790 [Longimicrobiales bacterium]